MDDSSQIPPTVAVETEDFTPQQQRKIPFVFIIVSLVLLIGTGVAGFMAGAKSNTTQKTAPTTTTTASSAVPTAIPTQSAAGNVNLFLGSERATLQGSITSTSATSVTIQDLQGKTQTFPLAKKVTINTFIDNKAQASSDITSVQLNQKGLIILDKTQNQYHFASITYFPVK